MHSLNTLSWRNLSQYPLRSILTALAITLGVGMLLAAAIIGQAASQSAAGLSDDGPDIDLEVFARNNAPFDAVVLDTLRNTDDVARVSPTLRVAASAPEIGAPETGALTVLGVEPDVYSAMYSPELANGTFLEQPDTIVLPMAIAIDNRLNVGDQITLQADGQPLTLVVAGRLRLEQDVTAFIGADANLAYIPLAAAQTLNGTPRQIDSVAVVLQTGADGAAVKDNLAVQLDTNLVVVQTSSGSTDLPVLFIQGGLAMVGVIMLFAAAFVIMNAFAMSITARTQEIGALRSLGMTRRQVLRQVLTEAILLGLAGTALGVLVGIGLAWGVMRIRGTLDDITFAVPWWGLALSVAVGLGMTLAGALQPAWRASRISPLVAMRSQSQGGETGPGWYVQHGGRVGGIILLVVFLILTATAFIWQPDFIWAAALLGLGQVGALLGTVLVLPALVNPVARLTRPVLRRWFGTAGRLAADNLARNKLRTALTAAALTIGLTMIIATSTLTTVSLEGGLNSFFTLFNEQGIILPDITALLSSGELSMENSLDMLTVDTRMAPELVEAVESVAEAEGLQMHRYGFASVPPELSTLPGSPGVFVDPEIFLPMGNFDFFEGDPGEALELMQRGRAVLLIPITAARLGVGVGDTVAVQTPQGEVEFTVAGIGGNATNFAVFPYADGETYFDLPGPSWLGIIIPAGQDIDVALAQVQHAIEPFGDVIVFDVRDSGVGGLVKLVDQLQSLLNTLLLLAVVVAALGVVNTVVINVAERRREIALLRAVGATQRQVRQMVMAEAATLGLFAALLAIVLALGMLVLFVVIFAPNGATSMGMRVSWETVGQSLPPALRDLAFASLLSLLFAPLVAALAAYYPARQAAALEVAEATRSEQVTLKSSGKARRPKAPTPA